jgi:hypothetical protein
MAERFPSIKPQHQKYFCHLFLLLETSKIKIMLHQMQQSLNELMWLGVNPFTFRKLLRIEKYLA